MSEKSARFEFFLGELFKEANEDAGIIIELMRAAKHVQDFRRLTSMLLTSEGNEIEDLVAGSELDPARVMIFNFTASQLREGLKLFHKFAATKEFKVLEGGWSKEQRQRVARLTKCVHEFNEKKGLLYAVLLPLRNLTYHYDARAAAEWLKGRLEDEAEPKPATSLVDLEAYQFGPGEDRDEHVFAKHLAWGEHGPDSFLQALQDVWELQSLYLQVVKDVVERLLRKAGINNDRPFGWILEHRYGFKCQ